MPGISIFSLVGCTLPPLLYILIQPRHELLAFEGTLVGIPISNLDRQQLVAFYIIRHVIRIKSEPQK